MSKTQNSEADPSKKKDGDSDNLKKLPDTYFKLKEKIPATKYTESVQAEISIHTSSRH